MRDVWKMTHYRLIIEDSKKRLRKMLADAKVQQDIAIIEKEISMLKSLFKAEESEK